MAIKKFNPIGIVRKHIVLILVLTILCSALTCFLVNKKQSYSASILIEYTGAKAEQGLNPDDSPIDITEIYSATVIDNVIRNLNLTAGVEEIRSSITVAPVIPLTEVKRETAAIEINDEYSFIPTKYLITYTADSDYSEEYAREVLDSILMQYYILYSQKYVENLAYPNNAMNISLDNYDYIECIEILQTNINSIATFCMARDASFYSAKSGYSFVDLQLELEYLRDSALYDLNTYVLENQVTMDRNLLLQKKSNAKTQYEIKIENIKEYIEKQKIVIDQFAQKTLDGQAGMGNLEEAGIVTNVEDNYYIYRGKIDTTYDILINNYVKLLTDLNYYESELTNTEKILEIYSKNKNSLMPDNSNVENEAAPMIAKEKLSYIIESFNSLYDEFVVTVKDYYNVRSADYMSFNSNVNTTTNVNLKLYLILALFMFTVLWMCFFIVWDRLKEILKSMSHPQIDLPVEVATDSAERAEFLKENEAIEKHE